jgi:hypothetical protein
MATEFDERVDRCPECGAAVSGGRAGCQRLFDEVIAREFGDFRYAREHRLTVDAYSLQHPDEYMRSAKSYAAHLTGAYIAVESGAVVAEANRAVQQWLGGSKALRRPAQPEPGQRGTLTIQHLHVATDPDDHLRRVREWARSAWAAWQAFHPTAKQWTDEALGSQRKLTSEGG